MTKREKIIRVEVAPVRKRWLSSAEAEKYLGVEKRTLRNMRDSGQIDFCRANDDGRNVWYDLDSIDAFLESRLVNKRIREDAERNRRTPKRVSSL